MESSGVDTPVLAVSHSSSQTDAIEGGALLEEDRWTERMKLLEKKEQYQDEVRQRTKTQPYAVVTCEITLLFQNYFSFR